MKPIVLNSSHSLSRALSALSSLPLDGTWEVGIREVTRSSEDNAALHAMLTDISRQVQWYGQSLSVEVWKRLCVAAWLRETGGNPLLVPALDGAGVDIIYEKTSKMSHKQVVSLIAWVEAFGAEKNVKFTSRREEG